MQVTIMIEQINQCCYTHKGSWTTVAQKGTFDQKYVGELSRHATLPGPEYGSNLSVYETVGDGDKFLIMRTQYGLKDLTTESGRASMFSHGFLIDTSGEKFDPNTFLTVSRDNFCIEEAAANRDKEHLMRTKSFSLTEAMATAGLTQETFSKLVKCVYQLSVRSINKQALFIQAKDETQLIALLYCIYAALLPRYSKFISSSSVEYNFSDTRNIVFTTKVNTSKKFFIPETGENNVLSVNVEKNIDSLYFVDYGVKNFSTTEAIQEYYIEFEKTLKKISNAKQVNDDVIRLAHVMTADPIPSKESDVVSDDEALMAILQFATEFNDKEQNEFVKEYIEKLREEAIKRGLIKIETPKPVASETIHTEDAPFANKDNTTEYPVGSVSSPVNMGTRGDIPFSQGGSSTRPPDVVVDKTRPIRSSGISTDPSSYRANYYRNGLYGSATENGHFEYGGRDVSRAFSETEKRKFKNDLIMWAKKGSEKFPEFKHVVEVFIGNNSVQKDVSVYNEFVRIIFDALCEMILSNSRNMDTYFKDNIIAQFEEWCKQLYLSIANIKYYRNKLILYYWKNNSWNNFTVKKITEYRLFMIPEQDYTPLTSEETDLINKACNINNIADLIMPNKVFSAADWLSNLNVVFRGKFTAEEKRSLTKRFVAFYSKGFAKDKIANSVYFDVFCVQYLINFAVYYQTHEFEVILNAWQCIYLFLNNTTVKKDDKDLETVIETILEMSSIKYASLELKKFVFTSTNNLFIELEARKIQVPFDFWLALGNADDGHPFQMFYAYEYEPMVKSISPLDVLDTSILLKKEEYVDLLNDEANKTKDKFIKGLAKAVNGDDGGIGGKFKSIFGRKK